MGTLSPRDPRIGAGCDIADSRFGRFVSIGPGSRVLNSDIGDYSYTDRCADIANASIAKFSNIASHARIGPSDHPLDRASLHHFMYRPADYWEDAEHDEGFFAHRASRRCTLGNDTWIGHNAVIRPEVTVHDGAVVATGSVVTRDVAPYTIVAGIPARTMRERQPPNIAERLIALAWWDWPHNVIRKALDDFRSLSASAFLEKYEETKPYSSCDTVRVTRSPANQV